MYSNFNVCSFLSGNYATVHFFPNAHVFDLNFQVLLSSNVVICIIFWNIFLLANSKEQKYCMRVQNQPTCQVTMATSLIWQPITSHLACLLIYHWLNSCCGYIWIVVVGVSICEVYGTFVSKRNNCEAVCSLTIILRKLWSYFVNM